MAKAQRQRAVLIALTAVGAALFFWLTSRYPELDLKAAMAGEGNVSDVLSVWPLFEVKPEYSFFKKVFFSTLNWGYDNKKGMLFGVFMGACFLTALSYIALPKVKSRTGGALLGFLVGTPLGVCVNCAAPVMKGVLKSRRVETAFAAMLSSPTMNVVVLTMVFTLFPFYMAMVKVLFSLFAIFVGVPFLSRVIGTDKIKDLEAVEGGLLDACEIPNAHDESLIKSVQGAFTDLAKNFWYMCKTTVPLMALAGFLGALLTHLIPFGALDSTGGVVALVVATLVSIALPCPIAFDVLLTNALYQQGLDAGLTLVLLCTLGIYSVYPFFITWTSASRAWALGLLAWFCVTGLIIGLFAKPLHAYLYTAPSLRAYRANIESHEGERAISVAQSPSGKRLSPRVQLRTRTLSENDDVLVKSTPFAGAYERVQEVPAFIKREGHDIGLVRGFRYGIRDYPDHFWIGRGTAAGDFDDDGFVDIAFGTDTGIVLYKNDGGHFEQMAIEDRALSKRRVYALAFVDLSGDGRLDLFYSTFNEGNFIVPNTPSGFDFSRTQALPNKGVLCVAPAFGDVNNDGLVDIICGNMALGVITGSHQYQSGRDNIVYINRERGRFEANILEGPSGESMSTLLSDLDQNGHLDLVVGNDFIVPDAIYEGSAKGFRRVKKVPYTPVFSMGADSGDIDNDGDLDLLMTGTIARKKSVPKDKREAVWGLKTCQKIRDEVARKNCEVVRQDDDIGALKSGGSVEITRCLDMNIRDKQACLLAAGWALVTHNDFTENCEKTFENDALLKEVCVLLKPKEARYVETDFDDKGARQIDQSFLFLNDNNRYQDANKAGVSFSHPGGWTWGARIADLDNDGWQDVFNTDGTVRKNDFGWNVFMRNQKGKGFEEAQFAANLTDPFSLFSFVTIDFDHDGDLDIIGNSSTGPVQVYENQSSRANHALSVELFDHTRDNRAAIGARVFVRAGDLTMMREVKASGGYQSSNAQLVHFGLAKNTHIDELKIEWPSGTQTLIKSRLKANTRLRIEKKR